MTPNKQNKLFGSFSCTQLTNLTLLLNSGAHLRGNEQQSINTNFYIFLQSFYAMHAHRQVLQRIYAHIVSTDHSDRDKHFDGIGIQVL